ncbi:unnamed protein product, partial [Thlaspi arvense]
IEIKAGSPFKFKQEDGYVIRVTQVTLGESKKVKDEAIHLYVKVGGSKEKLLVGNLSQKIPQLSMDLIFEQDFEFSHECKNSSVFVLGYKSYNDDEVEDFDSDDEDIPMDMFQNQLEKANANGVNDEKANLEAGEDDSDDEDESDSDEMGSDEDEDDSSDEEEEEEEAPVEVEPPSKKRPNGGAVKNTNASKKAKVATHHKHSGKGCC